MKRIVYSLPLIALVSCNNQEPVEPAITYPETRKDTTVTDTFYGEVVADPYRWLEDDRSAETEAWVAEQNKVTAAFLEKIPYRADLRKRLEAIWNYEKYSAPFKEGDYTYYFKNDGLQNQSVLYREKDGETEVFLDPNTFSEDGTTSLAGLSFSKDGSLLAYQISEGGSDWRKVIVMDAKTKAILEDTLTDVKFSGLSWKENEGFYYSSYDKPKEGSELSGLTQHHKLYFHQLKTPQHTDRLIFGGEETPRRYIGAGVTEDQRFLVITAAVSTTGNELYMQDLSAPGAPIRCLVNNFDNEHNVLYTRGEEIFIQTNLNAPNNRVVKTTWNKPEPANWTDLIPETDQPLSAATAGGHLFCSYLKDATSQVKQYSLGGNLEREIELPGLGSASGFGGKEEDEKIYYSFTSYVYPVSIFEYEIATGLSKIYRKSGVDFDPDKYESRQVFYTSKDGTRVPMIITHKKGLEMNGKNPTLLYGYGGFGVNLTPSFSLTNAVWMENGGIYAVPNLRGGGEYGEEWHKAGTKTSKQNVFDDFIAAAEYLIEQGYTSGDYLAVSGGSNGGLLVGATMTQRPDLMKVALPAVGVMDMLRYHRFTAGAGWAYDYGTVDESEEMFRYLLGYSPVHNLKEGVSYPATLVTTADHDDRVVPAHSFKFAAGLQAAQAGPAPVLIRIETNAGHGAGKPTAMIIEEQVDKLSFVWYNMGFKTMNIVGTTPEQ